MLFSGNSNFINWNCLALIREVSQSLAGRTAVLHLLPLSRQEANRFPSPSAGLEEALFTGSYPEVLGNPKWTPAAGTVLICAPISNAMCEV